MASTYLSSQTLSSEDSQTFTFSAWVKQSTTGAYRGIIGNYSSDNTRGGIYFHNNDGFYIYTKSGGSNQTLVATNAKYRDTNGWYHLVVEVDTTQATAADRVKLYVNGEYQDSLAETTYPSQNANLTILTATDTLDVGNFQYGTGPTNAYWDGQMAHVHFIDGTAYDADTFGQTESSSGIWIPKPNPSVTYGTNGFFLKFQDSSSLGDDSSGNTNDFTVNGTGTQTLDTPSNVFCTLNALDKDSAVTLSNGNLTSTGGQNKGFRATQAFSQGKWYWEVKWNSGGGAPVIGIADDAYTTSSYLGSTSKSWGYYNLGDYYNNASTNSYGNSFASGDIIGVALDADNGYLYFSKNGTFQNSGDPTSGATGTGGISVSNPRNGLWFPAGSNQTGTNISFNFGNGYFGTTAVASANSDTAGIGQFEYSVPSGYYALCTKNIAEYG